MDERESLLPVALSFMDVPAQQALQPVRMVLHKRCVGSGLCLRQVAGADRCLQRAVNRVRYNRLQLRGADVLCRGDLRQAFARLEIRHKLAAGQVQSLRYLVHDVRAIFLQELARHITLSGETLARTRTCLVRSQLLLNGGSLRLGQLAIRDRLVDDRFSRRQPVLLKSRNRDIQLARQRLQVLFTIGISGCAGSRCRVLIAVRRRDQGASEKRAHQDSRQQDNNRTADDDYFFHSFSLLL